MTSSASVVAVLLALQFRLGAPQIYSCPLQWEGQGDACYQFVFAAARTYDEAASACWTRVSALVSINDAAEHRFVQEFLGSHVIDRSTCWFTSGLYHDGVVSWYGDGTFTNETRDETWWIVPGYYMYTVTGNKVTYTYSTSSGRFAWSLNSGWRKCNYICEIPRREVHRLIQMDRDFSFGLTNASSSGVISTGPRFLSLPPNEVVVDSSIPLMMECLAEGSPQPAYRWYIKNPQPGNNFLNNYREITPAEDSRYTFSNGRLTITRPADRSEAGSFICEARNNLGSILSPPILISFGYLNQFSPNQQGFVQANLLQGTFFNCNAPSAKPALSYQWYKDNIRYFIRPELNTYFFISQNGNLYFSEVQDTDRGDYYCVVTLVPRVGEVLSTNQPVSRTSRAIELRIVGTPSQDYGPIIHPDFIAVFPKPPLVGHDVRLECFAYGRLPLQYSWSRSDGSGFPHGTYFLYENRVMVIPNAQFEDGGNYTCTVLKITGTQSAESRSIFLSLEAKPYFLYPLRNVHADVGSELTWRCEARAVPRPTYTWYKNSQVVQTIAGEVEVRQNVLYVKRLDMSRDPGMYQCEASNAHGSNKTSAQLRVLSFPPNFERFPLPLTSVAAEGGNLTLTCQPEAAPQAEVTWLVNGQPIGAGDQRHTLSWSGTLHVTQVTRGDQGVYTCQARNAEGEAQSSTTVTVTSGIQLQTSPSYTQGRVNTTAFLFCQASYDVNLYDLTYVWKFNGKIIDVKNSFFFQTGDRENIRGLYIRNAQFYHTGIYECIAQTVLVSISASAEVVINGPPAEPAGVYVIMNPRGMVLGNPVVHSNTTGIARVVWTWNPAAEHGFPVLFFDIEARTILGNRWEWIASNVRSELTILDGSADSGMKHFYDVPDLLPYNSYQFRVRAVNQDGVGAASSPSSFVCVPMAAPMHAPSGVGGGGGSVGVLTITWNPLRPEEEGGPDFGYHVFWLKAEDRGTSWNQADVGRATKHVVTVGLDNFYKPYDVKVRAYNRAGSGPVSPVEVVYSAEGMPPVRPTNVRFLPINGTAVTITWDEVPSTREAAGGRVLGYQIDYVDGFTWYRNRAFVHCQCGQGDIIGLEPMWEYWVNVEVFNSAGTGIPSERYKITTLEYPPSLFPQFVDVQPHGPHSAYVTWRGISILNLEGTLTGYKLMYWPANEDHRMANYTTVESGNEAVIYALQTDIVYMLRVMGMTRGGDGRKSPTLYFTLLRGGGITINRANFDPTTSQFVMASAPGLHSNTMVTSVTSLVFAAWQHTR